jgi:excisionase family DNA binding protein
VSFKLEENTVPHFSRDHSAFLIGVHKRTVRRWIKAEKIFAYKVGNTGTWYIPLDDINDAREKHGYPPLTPQQAVNAIIEDY